MNQKENQKLNDVVDSFWDFNDIELFSRLLYGEARGESLEGQKAVACVVMNRVSKGGWFGCSLKDVILKRKQFSCFDDNDPNCKILKKKEIKNKDFSLCFSIAEDFLMLGYQDITEGATHYHTKQVTPSWSKNLTFIKEFGNHKFYK